MKNAVNNGKVNSQEEIPARAPIFDELKKIDVHNIYATPGESFNLSRFKDSEKNAKECKEKAKKLCSTCDLSSLGLTEEDVFVIYASLYNIRSSSDSGSSVLNRLNEVLISSNKYRFTEVRPFLLYLLSSLRTLPIVDNSQVLYRCEDGELIDMECYKPGCIVSWPGCTVTSKTEDLAKYYAKASKKSVIFEVRGAYTGYNVKQFTDVNEDGKYYNFC